MHTEPKYKYLSPTKIVQVSFRSTKVVFFPTFCFVLEGIHFGKVHNGKFELAWLKKSFQFLVTALKHLSSFELMMVTNCRPIV